jgi:hypothetical protein
VLHFPEDFEISVGRPAEAYKIEKGGDKVGHGSGGMSLLRAA